MIVGSIPQLLDIAFLERGAAAGKAVARLDLEYSDGNVSFGTAFLIASDLALTAHHVLFGGTHRELRRAMLRFDYAAGVDGMPLATIERAGDIPSIAGDPATDWAVIRLDQSAPRKFPRLLLGATAPTRVGDSAYIIQHPHAGLKQVAMGIRAVAHIDDQIVRYAADTLPGSSGAPVFNEAWEVIAMHCRSQSAERVNQGIRIEQVLRGLREMGIDVDTLREGPSNEQRSEVAPAPRMIISVPDGSRTRSVGPKGRIYVSACSADQHIAEKLETYLAPLVKAAKALVWHRGKVPPGANVADVAARQLRHADVVLVLMSADYFQSNEAEQEGNVALALSTTQGTRVIPILARSSMWETTQFCSLQILPRDGLPLMRATEQEETFVSVARAIGAALSEGEF